MATSIPRLVRQAQQWPELARCLPAADDLAAPTVGAPVVAHRSSWVRRLQAPGGDVFIKTYSYYSWADRLRAIRRTGPLAWSRAAREFDAATWLRANQLGAPEPLAVLEWRRTGFLWRATLVTAAVAGETADRILARLPQPSQIELVQAIGRYLSTAHRLGYRDRNFDLRNLIVSRGPDGFHISKVDSPRYRLRAPGVTGDALARADWQRLRPQLVPFGGALVDALTRANADPRS